MQHHKKLCWKKKTEDDGLEENIQIMANVDGSHWVGFMQRHKKMKILHEEENVKKGGLNDVEGIK